MSSRYWYAVVVGRKPGVYTTWAECQAQVSGFSNCSFKKYNNANDALAAVAAKNIYATNGSNFNEINTINNIKNPIQSHINSDNHKEKQQINTDLSSDSNVAIAFIDGSSLGNGKSDSKGGCSVHFPYQPNYSANKILLIGTTNDRAEKEAYLLAYDRFQHIRRDNPKIERLHIYSDSNTLVKTVNEWIPGWKANNWKRKGGEIANIDLVKAIDEVNSTGVVTITHVKAHTGGNDFYSVNNAIADDMANSAAQGCV